MMKRLLVLCSLLPLLIISVHAQTNWREKVDDLLLTGAQGHQEVMILMKGQADLNAAYSLRGKDLKGQYVFNQLAQHATQSQASIQTWMDQKGIPYRSYHIVNCLWARVDMAEIQAIASRADVALVAENSRVMMEKPFPSIEPVSHNRAPVTWGLNYMQVEDVWNMGYRGQGVVVGGQDTGYEWEHKALKPSYRGWDGTTADHNYNWHDAIHQYDTMHADTINPCGLDTLAPCDDDGHGTHTVGTMTGVDSTEQIGVAPDAKWIGCRNMERGYGTPATYLECFEWFLAPTNLADSLPDPSKAPHVINNSWSCPPEEGCNPSNFALMEFAVNNLRAAGVVVVVSAGNSGRRCGTVSTPAAMFEGSFTVGALRANDTIARFSSRGPVLTDSSFRLKPNVVAPGHDVRSAVPVDSFTNWAGTSMAGPHVAGLVALLISADPSLAGDVDRIEDIIERTAIPHTTNQTCDGLSGNEVPNHTYGYGAVNALAAVMDALASTKVESLEERIFTISPQPFSHELTLESTQAFGQVTLDLFSLDGRHLFQETWNASGTTTHTLALGHLAAGAYFFRINHVNGVQVGKVLKN